MSFFIRRLFCPQRLRLLLIPGVLAVTVLTVSKVSGASEQPAQDPFALGVRDTEPLTAAEQQKTFQLPPGFSIQLVAAEPQIAKPMNLAFDVRGRLWVTSSEEYPFAAKDDQTPRDTVKILEDTDGDGLADVVKTFADQLNIPIGLYPYRDGVICFSIPDILFLRDTDGDDRCDVREVLYGPFDTSRDTHGMCNAFRRGDDGWIYACHGFNNQSQVTGRDGNQVVMHSGNTFRFRPDGSRIEHFTHGQVNPFGMAVDRFGDLFTADCHTKPVTLLMQGGYYDSFGKPHDGLGYVPGVMDHLHGSTAIGGIALGEQTRFPADYQHSSFGGNVMTSRINRNRLDHAGSTVRAVEQPDLLSCRDPWFRPVDLVAGPDGALYIADFYNRIIGHYEVDLMHPGRDRHRGRIWKISYNGNTDGGAAAGQSQPADSSVDITGNSTEQLIEILRTALPQSARMIADHLADNIGEAAVPLLQKSLRDDSATLRRRALRILQRLHAADEAVLQAAADDPDEAVRVHCFRTLRECGEGNSVSAVFARKLILQGFQDPGAMVRRAAVQAAANHLDSGLIAPLLSLFHQTDSVDLHLRHAIRMVLRDHLRNDEWCREIMTSASDPDAVVLAGLSLSLKTAPAGEFIAEHVALLAEAEPDRLAEYLQFAAAYVSPESAAVVAKAVRAKFDDNIRLQIQLLDSMEAGFAQRSLIPPSAVTDWAEHVVLQLLEMRTPEDLQALQRPAVLSWSYVPHPDSANPDNLWMVSTARQSADGMKNTPLFSSIEKGENRTGIYRSAAFTAGDSFSFYLAGHDGFPDKPAGGKNTVRLHDAVSGEVLVQAAPPRNDVAQKVEWSTAKWKGRSVRLELVDGDTAGAFAWLAAGRFSDERLNPNDTNENRRRAADVIGDYRLKVFVPALRTLLENDQTDRDGLAALASAFVKLHPDNRMAAAAMIPNIAGASAIHVQQAIDAILKQDIAQAQQVLADSAQSAAAAEQLRLAEQLAADGDGAETLLSLVAAGKMSARLLQRPSVRQRLDVIRDGALKPQLEHLTAGLPAEDAAVEKLIRERRRRFLTGDGLPDLGKELFKKHCAVCHQVAGEGKKVGPNLDGIGNRGPDRLIEDVLAPNRNVDVAFRTTTVVTTDGKAISGLLRELENDRISIVDSQGRETLMSLRDVDERIASSLSPMPANIAELVTEDQLQHLLTYLASLRH